MIVDIECPVCGAPEVNPDTDMLNIRALKVFDSAGAWSCCMTGKHGDRDKLVEHRYGEYDPITKQCKEIEIVSEFWFVT